MTPVVLLPGLMCDGRLFGPQLSALSTARAVHLAPIGGHDTVEALAAAVLADAPPRFAMAGLSMGGIVAMEVYRQAPARIDRIALLDTNPRPDAEPMKATRDRQIARVRAGELEAVMRDEHKPNYLLAGTDAILDLCMAMALGLGPATFERQSHALQRRPDQRPTLAKIDVPALILCGAGDQLCPPDVHRLMHDLIPHAQFDIVEGAGHLPTLEQPEATTGALARWLENESWTTY